MRQQYFLAKERTACMRACGYIYYTWVKLCVHFIKKTGCQLGPVSLRVPHWRLCGDYDLGAWTDRHLGTQTQPLFITGSIFSLSQTDLNVDFVLMFDVVNKVLCSIVPFYL